MKILLTSHLQSVKRKNFGEVTSWYMNNYYGAAAGCVFSSARIRIFTAAPIGSAVRYMVLNPIGTRLKIVTPVIDNTNHSGLGTNLVCGPDRETIPAPTTLPRSRSPHNVIHSPSIRLGVYQYFIWRHGSASILGTTRTDTRAPMLMYWVGLSRIASPQEIRLWIGLTNGV